MNRRATLKRFIQSLPALSIHTLCIGGSVSLGIGLLHGNAPPGALTGICFLLATYPVLLGLAWWQYNDDSTLVVIDDTEFDDVQLDEPKE